MLPETGRDAGEGVSDDAGDPGRLAELVHGNVKRLIVGEKRRQGDQVELRRRGVTERLTLGHPRQIPGTPAAHRREVEIDCPHATGRPLHIGGEQAAPPQGFRGHIGGEERTSA